MVVTGRKLDLVVNKGCCESAVIANLGSGVASLIETGCGFDELLKGVTAWR